MAFDGITVAGLAAELMEKTVDGSIARIIQPERDELQLMIKKNKVQYYLTLSANASLPLLYLTETKKEAPLSAPNFCMLLRKHLQGGRIISVEQPSFERILVFTVRSRDEMGDLRDRKLIVELMGKHSNIIFTDEDGRIIDSIKRVPASMSSIREVLPGKQWFITAQEGKMSPLRIEDGQTFRTQMEGAKLSIVKGLYGKFTGLSPSAAEELVFRSGADPRKTWEDLEESEKESLTKVFCAFAEELRQKQFAPCIIYEGEEPKEFGGLLFTMYGHPPFRTERMDSASDMVRTYYGSREEISRMRQKSSDLRHVVNLVLDRTCKKLELQEKQLAGSEKREKFRIWGEMLNTYGYQAEEGASGLKCLNYYNNEEIVVPLDPTLTPSENAQKYFARYNKLKRTAGAMEEQIRESRADREQLESILMAIDLAESERDLAELRKELEAFGFVQRKAASSKGARREAKSEPYSYRSSDGFLLYVGRNNYQNDELSFKIADGNDWWFHVKGAPGSHVILKSGGREVPDRAFEEAGALAAYYSSQRHSPKVEVDYTLRKNLRRTNGGKPGFVIYHTNYSLVAAPDISALERL